ncbi:hypothetical protein N0V86_006331 [Didymella sp. IMI 355093]|nr:hypothetical protein N0V86_006331 [Didymella sp. IMI 355093]
MQAESASEARIYFEHTSLTLDIVTMLVKSVLYAFVIILAALAPAAAASGNSDKYDIYNRCGAPFCGSTGSTGNVAAAGAFIRNSTTNTMNEAANVKDTKW